MTASALLRFLCCYHHRFQLFEVTQGFSHGECKDTICEMPIAAFVKPTLMDSPSNDVHFTDQSAHPHVLPFSTRPAQDVALPQQVYPKLPSRVSSWQHSSQIQHSNVSGKKYDSGLAEHSLQATKRSPFFPAVLLPPQVVPALVHPRAMCPQPRIGPASNYGRRGKVQNKRRSCGRAGGRSAPSSTAQTRAGSHYLAQSGAELSRPAAQDLAPGVWTNFFVPL